jgi:hypothetical protein
MSQTGQAQVDRQKLAGLTDKLGDANDRLAQVKGTLPRLEADAADARAREHAVQEELTVARSEHRAKVTQVDTLTAQLSAAQISLAEKTGVADEMAKELDSANSRVTVLTGEVRRLEGELAVAVAARAATSRPTTEPAGGTVAEVHPSEPVKAVEPVKTAASRPATGPAVSTVAEVRGNDPAKSVETVSAAAPVKSAASQPVASSRPTAATKPASSPASLATPRPIFTSSHE